MIEVLVPVTLPLPGETTLIFFNTEDLNIAESLLRGMRLEWKLDLAVKTAYPRDAQHVANVQRFLRIARADASWRGDGLDFDNV